MESYAYAAPSSVAETVALLAQSANEGRLTQILAGGTDVLVQMRAGHTPRTIIDIKTLAETNRLDVSADGIYIGAAVPSAVINEHPLLQTALPGLLEAADLIGSTQIKVGQPSAAICVMPPQPGTAFLP